MMASRLYINIPESNDRSEQTLRCAKRAAAISLVVLRRVAVHGAVPRICVPRRAAAGAQVGPAAESALACQLIGPVSGVCHCSRTRNGLDDTGAPTALALLYRGLSFTSPHVLREVVCNHAHLTRLSGKGECSGCGAHSTGNVSRRLDNGCTMGRVLMRLVLASLLQS